MDAIKILSDLVRIDTSVPPGNNYEKAIDYLEPLFKQVGCQTQKIFIPKECACGLENRVNLLAHRRNPGKPRLIIYTHIDVNPAEGWNAFVPRVENKKLYGRGAADMKGGITALLLALNKTKNQPLDYDLSVIITTDEEIAGQEDELKYLGQFLEPLENSLLLNLDSEYGSVTIAALGGIKVKIKVKGKAAHSGLAHLGVNAIENSVPILSALLKLKKKVIKRKSKIRAKPGAKLKYLESRLNINLIKGGLKSNVIPDECLITLDRRFIPEENIKEVEKEIIDALKSVRGVNWEIDGEALKLPAMTVAEDDPIVNKLDKIIKKVSGKSGKYGVMGSSTIIGFTSKWNMKDIGLGVIRTECNIHADNEFVYLKDVESLAEILRIFLVSSKQKRPQ